MEKIIEIGDNKLIINSRSVAKDKMVIAYHTNRSDTLEIDENELESRLTLFLSGKPKRIGLSSGFFKVATGDIESSIRILKNFFEEISIERCIPICRMQITSFDPLIYKRQIVGWMRSSGPARPPGAVRGPKGPWPAPGTRRKTQARAKA